MIAPRQDDPAIELFHLTKRFGRTLAVNELSLKIPRGSTFGLLGPNGAGKSTAIKMMMGMLSITSGSGSRARCAGRGRSGGGQAAGGLRAPKCITCTAGCVSARRSVSASRASARGTTSFAARCSIGSPWIPIRRSSIFPRGCRPSWRCCWPYQHEPELLLLDEPLSGLDPIAREEFLDGVPAHDLRSRPDGAHFEPHVGRRAAAGRHGGQSCTRDSFLLHGDVDTLLTSTKRITATLRDGLPAGPDAPRHDLAADSGAGVDRYGARFFAGEGPAGQGD